MKRFTEIAFGAAYVGLAVLFGALSLLFFVPMYFFFILCEQSSIITTGCFAYAGAFLGYHSNEELEGNDDDERDEY